MVIAPCSRSRCSNIHRWVMKSGQRLCDDCRQEWLAFMLYQDLASSYFHLRTGRVFVRKIEEPAAHG